jgi:hypothetical protein
VPAVRLVPSPPRAARRRGLLECAYAFGLEFESSRELPTGRVERGAASRGLTWTLASRREVDEVWRPKEAESLLNRRHPSGRLMLTIEQHDELGYLIAAPGYGRHLVAVDGRSVLSYLPDVPPWRWQRLLFAQVLPLAASLQGFHVAHASAVALEDRAVAFVAPSGTGKTSVAAHLVARGATFLTDDALAIEPAAQGSLAHPGASVVSVRRNELQAMQRNGHAELGEVVGRSDVKLQIAIETVDRPLHLERIYFLRRDGRASRFSVDESAPPDPTLLLSSSFIWYLRDSSQLLARLEACAVLARTTRVFQVDIPPAFTAAAVAEQIERHAGAR